MTRVLSILLTLVITTWLPATHAAATSPAQMLRDAESYAIASCFANQSHAYLKDQGDAWASVIVQRSQIRPDALADIALQVKAELRKGNMAMMRDETRPQQDKSLPLLYCGEIIDLPAIRKAIQRASRMH